MKKLAFTIPLTTVICFFALSYAEPPSPEAPPTSAVESLVKGYVDKDFIHEELPPPKKCEQFSEKLMFAYDWEVVINKIGLYDPALKLLPVEATIIVRCGPLHLQSSPSSETAVSEFPIRSETPIDFQMKLDPKQPQKWKIHEVTLWKSKQKVIEQ